MSVDFFFGLVNAGGGVDLFFAISGFVIAGSLEPLCTLLVALAAAERELVGDCGIPRTLAWIGLRSCSLYLCHIPVALTLLALLQRRGDDPRERMGAVSLLLILAAGVVAPAIADLSYRFVERPLQRRFRPA